MTIKLTIAENSVKDPDLVADEKLSLQVAAWLRHCENSLDFLFRDDTPDLGVVEALQGAPHLKICDPISGLDEPHVMKKVERMEDMDSGENVPAENCLKGRNMLVVMANGDEASGRWMKGRREGAGCHIGPRLEKIGVHMIAGQYEDGVLTGLGKVIMKDDTVRQGTFQHGYLHGPVRGFRVSKLSGGGGHGDSGLSWIGHYRAGLPHGTCWVSMLGGGWLVGRVDDNGAFTGTDIAFLYSNLSTALVGEWRDGKLVAGRSSRLTGLQEVHGVLVPSFTSTDNSSANHYERWISTDSCMLCPPHRQDPYESTLVRVAKSEVEGGGEGLYARKNIPAGTLIAFYNGIRMTKEQRTPYGDTGYAIFVEWAERGRKTGDHMDLPPEFHASENYTSTLAHKLNHSFIANCEWSNAEHPCYGLVPSVTTCFEVLEGQELTVNYGLDMERAPQWYMDCWDLHSRIVN